MNSHHAVRFIVVASAALLGACGFHLRGEAVLPPTMHRVYVESSDLFSPLKTNVEAALVRSGAKVENAPGDGIAEVKLGAVSLAPIVRSVNSNARVSEFTMLYHVELEISDSVGKTLLQKQVIEQQRIFTFDQTQAIGTGAEQDIIKKEMERDMTQAILRRIDAVAKRA